MRTGAIRLLAGAAMMWTVCGVMNADYPTGYYNSLNGKCGEALRTAVKAMADGHKQITYGPKTWEAFKSTDVITIEGQDYWGDMYSSNLVPVTKEGQLNHDGLNIEHSVANSWWGHTKNAAYKDIVHLNPSDASANNRKSNYPLGLIQDVTWENGVTFVGTPMDGMGGGCKYVYEPADEYKGDFARAFMYVFATYDDIGWVDQYTWMYDISDGCAVLQTWARDLLLDWSANDAVSQKERNRNDGIYLEQNNRNPFIDLPDLAEHIWGSKSNEPYTIEGSDPGDVTEPQTDTYEWLADGSPTGSEGWSFMDLTVPEGTDKVWAWESINKTYFLKGSGYLGSPKEAESYAWSPEVDLSGCQNASFTFDHAAKFQTNIRSVGKVAVMNLDENNYIELLDIPSWPDGGNWKFSNSGAIDLTKYAGHRIRVGFRYKSTATQADTWEVNNAKLSVIKTQSYVKDVPAADRDRDDSIMVEVWGNNILAPEGALIFDLNGRRVSGENLAKGIYIVTKPTFRKAVKVMVK